MVSHGYQAKAVKMLTDAPATTHAGSGNGARNPEPEYAKFEDKPVEGKGLKDFREKANLKEKPTSADGKKGLKDLPSVISQVGNAASFLQNMYAQMSMVSALAAGSSQTSRKETIEDSLTGALSILANKWTYAKVIDVFDVTLGGDNIKFIDEVYRDLVKNAMAKLYLKAIEYGEDNIPVSDYPTVTEIGEVPGTIVTFVPNSYLQQYYPLVEDPYPGYIRWNSPTTDDFVFTERKLGDIYYSSPQEEVYSISEQELAADLDPYIEKGELAASDLNLMIREQETNVENNTDEKTQGKGASGPNAQEIASQILGYIGTISKLQQSLQLPVSVLSQGKMKKTLGNFEKQMTKLKSMKEMLKKAATPPQAASALGALSGLAAGGDLSSIASGIASGAVGSAVSSIAGTTAGNIAANIATTKFPSILKS